MRGRLVEGEAKLGPARSIGAWRRGGGEPEAGARRPRPLRAAALVGAGEARRLDRAVDVVSGEGTARLRVGDGDRAVDDREALQPHVERCRRRDGQRRQRAIGEQDEADHRLLQPALNDVDLAMQQRRHGQLEVEVADAHAQGCVVAADHRLVETKVGGRQQLQVDVAADRHLLPEGARQLRLQKAALAVPIDEVGRDQQRRQNDDEDDGEACEEIAQGDRPLAVCPEGLVRARAPSLALPAWEINSRHGGKAPCRDGAGGNVGDRCRLSALPTWRTPR